MSHFPSSRCRLCGQPIRVGDRLAAIPSAFDITRRGGQRKVVKEIGWDASVSWVHRRCAKPLNPALAQARAWRVAS